MAGRTPASRSRLEDFEALCRANGLSLTVQRRAILEAVLARHDHPTADQVYDAVKSRIPGVSRTTVYRVLETLVDVGVITRVCHPGGVTRFDPKVHQHHHLVCLECGAVTDVEDERLNMIALPPIRTGGFNVHEFHIHFRGVCAGCQKKRPVRQRSGAAVSTNRAAVGRRSSGRTKSTLNKRRKSP